MACPDCDLFQMVYKAIGQKAKCIDVLIALGTHPPMSDRDICQLLGIRDEERQSLFAQLMLFNHEWDRPECLTQLGTLSRAETETISGGLLSEEVPVTINARIACVSSFYRFLIRMSLVSANPCDQLERPKATPALPRGLTATDIKKLLEAIPNNPVGLRDRAIILTLTLTGRRRTEILNLKAGDLIRDGDAVLYSYRGKGGKHGKREMPQPALRAMQRAFKALGKDFFASDTLLRFRRETVWLRGVNGLSRDVSAVNAPHVSCLGCFCPCLDCQNWKNCVGLPIRGMSFGMWEVPTSQSLSPVTLSPSHNTRPCSRPSTSTLTANRSLPQFQCG
ncbi:MAG: tyrosine-type recombinase/integrase [Nitrospinae bacterium]|nr:tyrosine-type recombinase/integrase [Nitrospinota bacterium]